MVLKRITNDVRSSEHYSIIVDETPDISRSEQVSLCLRYVFEGQTLETFVDFFTTVSTEAEVLYELVKKQIHMLELKTENIVGECFDGTANTSGIHKGLAVRMKECSPLVVYVHCYGHLLNLTLQDSMTCVEPVRNALGIVQTEVVHFSGRQSQMSSNFPGFGGGRPRQSHTKIIMCNEMVLPLGGCKSGVRANDKNYSYASFLL